jgi:hypothetical protein
LRQQRVAAGWLAGKGEHRREGLLAQPYLVNVAFEGDVLCELLLLLLQLLPGCLLVRQQALVHPGVGQYLARSQPLLLQDAPTMQQQ